MMGSSLSLPLGFLTRNMREHFFIPEDYISIEATTVIILISLVSTLALPFVSGFLIKGHLRLRMIGIVVPIIVLLIALLTPAT